MNPAFPRKLLEMMRAHVQCEAENQTLVAILKTAVLLGQPPIGWEESLIELRQTDAYKKIAEQFAPLFADAERVVDIREVEQLLLTMPSARIQH